MTLWSSHHPLNQLVISSSNLVWMCSSKSTEWLMFCLLLSQNAKICVLKEPHFPLPLEVPLSAECSDIKTAKVSILSETCGAGSSLASKRHTVPTLWPTPPRVHTTLLTQDVSWILPLLEIKWTHHRLRSMSLTSAKPVIASYMSIFMAAMRAEKCGITSRKTVSWSMLLLTILSSYSHSFWMTVNLISGTWLKSAGMLTRNFQFRMTTRLSSS